MLQFREVFGQNQAFRLLDLCSQCVPANDALYGPAQILCFLMSGNERLSQTNKLMQMLIHSPSVINQVSLLPLISTI